MSALPESSTTAPAPHRNREAAIARLRRRQFGLITRAQAVATGYPPSTIDLRVERQVWEPWQRGVYAPAGLPRTFEANLMAAYLRGGEGAVVIGLSAARLWGFPDSEGVTALELAVPRMRAPRLRAPAIVRGYPWLRSEHQIRVGPFPVLRPEYALADLCRRWDDARVLETAADLWRRRRLRGPRALAEAAATRGRFRGAARLRWVVAQLDDAYAQMRSMAEIRAYAHFEGSDLPRPEINVRLRFASGRRWEFDQLWREVRAALEIDGSQHDQPLQAQRDRLKDRDAAAAGLLVRRVPAALVNDRDAYLAVVAQLLIDAAAGRGAPGPTSSPVD